MDENCGEWVESMGVVVRRYIYFLILLIPTPLVYIFSFCSSIPTFCSLKKMFFILVYSMQVITTYTAQPAGLSAILIITIL